MKYATLIVTIISFQFGWAQSIYGSVSGGYQRLLQSTQQASHIVNTYHQISTPSFWREEDFAFKDALCIDLSFGHMFDKYIGYELTGSYFRPFAVHDNDDYTTREFSGKFFRGNANIVLNIPLKKVDLYAKVGLSFAAGKSYYYQQFNNNGFAPLSYEEATLKYEYSKGSALGYGFALGADFTVNDRISLFTEVYSINQPFNPRIGKRTEQTSDGVDLMEYNTDPYFSEIEFGDESEWQNYNSQDKEQAQKLYKRYYSLGGVGIRLGVKFVLWEKQQEEFMEQEVIAPE
ncbi:MAG: hypothetical protein P8P74_16660 [Crocinitomicaceae bacterium]|nr:hypothetical protein [Crocinitomicaceae bacterium]